MFATSYASLQLRPAATSDAPADATTTTRTTTTDGALPRLAKATPPTFIGSLSVESNADGTSAAIIDYRGTEPGTYTATARWDNGPAEPVILDQPGEFGHEPTIGAVYAMRRTLGAGQHTLQVTVTHAASRVSATPPRSLTSSRSSRSNPHRSPRQT